MATLELCADNFEETVRGSGIVVVDFWAPWCGPCRAFAPVYEAAAARHGDVIFGRVDTDAEPELAAACEIRSIPTLMIFRDRVLLHVESGALPAAAFEELLSRTKTLDMDTVRRQLAADGGREEGEP